MVFGKQANKESNLSVNVEPEMVNDVFYMCKGEQDWTFLSSVPADCSFGDAVNACIALYGDRVIAVTLEPFKEE